MANGTGVSCSPTSTHGREDLPGPRSALRMTALAAAASASALTGMSASRARPRGRKTFFKNTTC